MEPTKLQLGKESLTSKVFFLIFFFPAAPEKVYCKREDMTN